MKKKLTALFLCFLLIFSAVGMRAEAAGGRNGERIRNGFKSVNKDSGEDKEENSSDRESEKTEAGAPEGDEKAGKNEAGAAEGDEKTGFDVIGYDDLVPCVEAYEVAGDLSNVTNLEYFYLNDDEKALLAENAFMVNASNWRGEFYEIYQENPYYSLPSFVTVDSIMHTCHLIFGSLLRNTEKNYLSEKLQTLISAMSEESAAYAAELDGTEWENAAVRVRDFFSVARALISGNDAEASDAAKAELSLIYDAAELTDSPVFEVFEDYSQYAPRGYYEGNAVLEAYFRTMMWLGRMNFSLKNDDQTRSAVLITCMLKDSGADLWADIYDITSYFTGVSDDPGYPEYDGILTAVLGENYTAADVMEDGKLEEIRAEIEKLEPAMIANSYDPETGVSEEICFRFMGQRFTVDAAVMQRLVSPEVGGRGLPDVLDLPAALGSEPALEILDEQGTGELAGYEDAMEGAQDFVKALPEDFWTENLYSEWLYTLAPVLREKGEGYPSFMTNKAWAKKNLETFAGSFAELKHDTILYSKQVMAEGDGDVDRDADDRGYVEPEYAVYERLSALVDEMLEGLGEKELIGDEDAEHLKLFSELSARLAEISRKELENEPLSDDDYELIRYIGETLGELWKYTMKDQSEDGYVHPRLFPASMIADIATDMDTGLALEIGNGNPCMLYVVAPVDGELHLMCGAVYNFYEFAWDSSDRLTDSSWRVMQGIQADEDGNYDRSSVLPVTEWTEEYKLVY